MDKSLKFRDYLVPMIMSGEKNVTWRLFDEKNLQKGDIVSLVNWNTGKEFAEAEIIKVCEKKFGAIKQKDFEGHEKFKSKEEMLETYSKYYGGGKVGWDNVVKIIEFKLLEKEQ